MRIIRKEITIKAPVEKVWQHLTEPKKIATWFLPTDFEASVGKNFTLQCEEEGAVYCVVREVVPREKLVYSFKAAGAKPETLVTFALSQLGQHTKLILTHSGWEGLPPHETDLFEKYEQGWGDHFLKRLTQLVETQEAS